jgi:hypothetical protein
VVRRYPRATLGLSSLVAVIATLLTFGLDVLVQDGLGQPLRVRSGPQDDTAIGGVIATTLGSVLVQLVVTIVLTGIITTVIGRAVLGRDVTARTAWAEARPHLLRLAGLIALYLLVLALAVVLPVVLGALALAGLGPVGLVIALPLWLAAVPVVVYLYVLAQLASPALVLERSGVVTSLKRSRVLIRGAFWRTFGILLLASVIAGVVSTILQVPFGVIAGLHGSSDFATWELVVRNLGVGVALLLTEPFSSGVSALLYLDRRMRAEGLDVTLAAAAAAP